MASSITARSSTPSRFPFPLHLLVPGKPEDGSEPITDRDALYKMWFISVTARRQIANKLIRIYKGGCGVVSPDLQRLFAVVEPTGATRALPSPHHFCQMWELANAPRPGPESECACAEFVDPEGGGPWRNRNSPDHHPVCQFDRHGMATFKAAHKNSITRILSGKRPIDRPDELIRIREQIRQT